MAYHILIVDDSMTTRAMIKRTLAMADIPVAQIHEAANGRIGLETLATHKIDLVLADLHMPEMGGVEMTRCILSQESTRHIPVVIISATTPIGANDRGVRMLSVGVLGLLVMLRIVQAVRANREAQEALLRSVRTDSLTGLPNRGHLLEHINATLRESWKGSEHPTLYFIDLDRCKNINDSLGHAAGDQVLCIVADRLRRAVPDRATVARISVP